MQNTFSNALSAAVSKHMPLSATRRETLAWLALLAHRYRLSTALIEIIVGMVAGSMRIAVGTCVNVLVG